MNSRDTPVVQQSPPEQPIPLVARPPPDPQTPHRPRLSSSTTAPLASSPPSPPPGRPERRSTSSIELAEFSTPLSRPSSPSMVATTDPIQLQARRQPVIDEPTSSSSSTSSTSTPHGSVDSYTIPLPTHVRFAQPERPISYTGRARQTTPHHSTRRPPGTSEQYPYDPYAGLSPFIPAPIPPYDPEYSFYSRAHVIPAPRPIRSIPTYPPVIPPVVPPVEVPFFVDDGQRRPAIRNWMLAASPESPYLAQMIGQHGWRQYIHPDGLLYWTSSEPSKPVVSDRPPEYDIMTLVDAQLQIIQAQADAEQWELYIGTEIHFVHHSSRSMSRASETFYSFKLRMERASISISMSQFFLCAACAVLSCPMHR